MLAHGFGWVPRYEALRVDGPHPPAPPPLRRERGVRNLEALAWYSVLIWGANLAREAFARPRVRQWMERVSGVALVGFGVRVAFDR